MKNGAYHGIHPSHDSNQGKVSAKKSMRYEIRMKLLVKKP